MTEKEKLIQIILNDESIQRYRRMEKIINNDKDLKKKINEMKSIQKQLINAKELHKVEAIKKFEERYQEHLSTIENYPLMSEYLALQGDINEMLQTIQNTLQDGIEKDFEKK